jgi:hypothetical protein
MRVKLTRGSCCLGPPSQVSKGSSCLGPPSRVSNGSSCLGPSRGVLVSWANEPSLQWVLVPGAIEPSLQEVRFLGQRVKSPRGPFLGPTSQVSCSRASGSVCKGRVSWDNEPSLQEVLVSWAIEPSLQGVLVSWVIEPRSSIGIRWWVQCRRAQHYGKTSALLN